MVFHEGYYRMLFVEGWSQKTGTLSARVLLVSEVATRVPSLRWHAFEARNVCCVHPRILNNYVVINLVFTRTIPVGVVY